MRALRLVLCAYLHACVVVDGSFFVPTSALLHRNHEITFLSNKALHDIATIQERKRGNVAAAAAVSSSLETKRDDKVVDKTNRVENKISNSESASSSFAFRRVEERDVKSIVRMYVREYGPSSQKKSGRAVVFSLFPDFLKEKLPPSFVEATQFIDNFALAMIIYLSLYQRIQRNFIRSFPEDHQVWCLTINPSSGGTEAANLQQETTYQQKQNEKEATIDVADNNDDIILAVAELSLQGLGQKSLPLALPIPLKKYLSSLQQKWQTQREEGEIISLQPYISNVLVSESHRGYGYGRYLMEYMEIEAYKRGYSHLTLHVQQPVADEIDFNNHSSDHIDAKHWKESMAEYSHATTIHKAASANTVPSFYQKLGYQEWKVVSSTKEEQGQLDRILWLWIWGIIRFLAGLYFLPSDEQNMEYLYMKKNLTKTM